MSLWSKGVVVRRCVIVVGSLSSVLTYPCVSRLTVEVCIFSGSSDDKVYGKRPGSLRS